MLALFVGAHHDPLPVTKPMDAKHLALHFRQSTRIYGDLFRMSPCCSMAADIFRS
jgi:hypothetical protein